MSRNDLHFRLRIPADLKERVLVSADQNHRSMTAEIVAVLQEKFPAPIESEQLTNIRKFLADRGLDDSESEARNLLNLLIVPRHP